MAILSLTISSGGAISSSSSSSSSSLQRLLQSSKKKKTPSSRNIMASHPTSSSIAGCYGDGLTSPLRTPIKLDFSGAKRYHPTSLIPT